MPTGQASSPARTSLRTCARFKGLERPVVVLAVNGFREMSRAKEMLYVGLSRAQTLLVVCGDSELVAAVGGEGVRLRLTT